MSRLLRTLAIAFVLVLPPSLVGAQGTDRSEMDRWMKMTEHQTEPSAGMTITMANWRQYQSVMPLGMIKLFQGVYDWKMPADVQMPVATPRFDNVPKTCNITAVSSIRQVTTYLPSSPVSSMPCNAESRSRPRFKRKTPS
jgi:hypothetical protein